MARLTREKKLNHTMVISSLVWWHAQCKIVEQQMAFWVHCLWMVSEDWRKKAQTLCCINQRICINKRNLLRMLHFCQQGFLRGISFRFPNSHFSRARLWMAAMLAFHTKSQILPDNGSWNPKWVLLKTMNRSRGARMVAEMKPWMSAYTPSGHTAVP